MPATSPSTESLSGSIERVTFHNPDNGFATRAADHVIMQTARQAATACQAGMVHDRHR